jgi:hypothetical protein
MKSIWISTESFTGYCVVTNNGLILKTSPILKRFGNQTLDKLKYWLQKRFKYVILKELHMNTRCMKCNKDLIGQKYSNRSYNFCLRRVSCVPECTKPLW